jgi:hypothetical protein
VTTKTTPALLPFPTTLIVVKGCPALNVAIREHWNVKEVRELGPDYGHSTSIVIERAGKTLTFEVRHVNRLSDQEFNARRWGKPVRFARGPQDARVRFVSVADVIATTTAGTPIVTPPVRKVWTREIVAVAP